MKKWRFINTFFGFCFLGTSITVAAPIEYWQNDATSATGTGATLNEALGTNSLSSGSKFILNENVTAWTAPLLIGSDDVTTQISIESAGNTTPTYSITGGGVVSGNPTNTIINRILSTKGNIELTSNTIYENGYVFSRGYSETNWNQHGMGGAISSEGTLKLAGNNVFQNNTAYRNPNYIADSTGYGGAISSADNLTITGTNKFIGNTAGTGGGAIYGAQNVDISGKYEFTNNSVVSDGAVYGGAIAVHNGLKINGDEGSIFQNNTSTFQGGAIWVGVLVEGGPSGLELSGHNEFIGNSADKICRYVQSAGGAIYIQLDTPTTMSGTNIFTNNTSVSGGAIASASDINISGQTSFTNNQAWCSGGAIYMYGNDAFAVTFSGDGSNATFSGNVANKRNENYKGNDIYNATGSVNFQDKGTYSFDGGMYTKELNLSTGAKVTLKAGAITEVDTTTVIGGPTLDTNTLLEVELADTTVFQTNSLLVSGSFHILDYGYSGKETPIAVGEGIDFIDNSTIKISFDENLTLEEGEKYTLFTSTTGATLGENMIYEYLGTNIAKEELNVFVEGLNIVMQVGKLPDPNAVPEPATWVTLLLGVGGILYIRRRK